MKLAAERRKSAAEGDSAAAIDAIHDAAPLKDSLKNQRILPVWLDGLPEILNAFMSPIRP